MSETAQQPGILRFQTNIPLEVALKFQNGLTVESKKGYGPQVMYTLDNDDRIYVPPIVEKYIKQQAIQPGERFLIAKMETKNGQRRAISWEVRRIDTPQPASQRPAPAQAAAPPRRQTPPPQQHANMEPVLQQSIEEAQSRRAQQPPAQPRATAAAPAPNPPHGHQNGQNGQNHNNTPTNGNNGRVGARIAAPGPPEMPEAPLPEPPGEARRRVAGPPNPPTKMPIDKAVVEAVRIVQEAMKETGEQWSDAAKQDLVSTIIIAARQEGWLAMWKRGGGQ